MELLQLKYFCAAAENQHITKTAEQLHIAQPALTQSIHRLEKELGVPLFVSKGRNIVLTEYGAFLHQKLKPIIASLDSVPTELEEMAHIENATVHINVRAASTLVTNIIIAYKKQNSHINFKLSQTEDAGNSDILVSTGVNFQEPENVPEENIKIYREKIFLAVPVESPLSQFSSLPLSEVKNEDFISLSGFKNFRSICDRYCLNQGFTPSIVFESDSTADVRKLIGAKLGLGFWPQFSWGKTHRDDVALIPISGCDCHRDIKLEYRNIKQDAKESRKFFRYMCSRFEKLWNE